MKLSSLVVLLAVSALLTACSSLENPFTNWFHGNHDGRVYNTQTGEWEYPSGSATPRPQKSAAVAGALASNPAPNSASPSSSDGRYFDPQKNQWVELHNGGPSSSSSSSASSSPSGGEPAASAVPAPAPAPAPPRPAKDSGIYNPTTGKIEWQSSGGTAPSYAAVSSTKPARVKHWWWPF